MRVAVGCDHRGFPYKAGVIEALARDGHAVLDLGSGSTDPVDYPDFARLVGLAVRDGRADLGVLICGSGAGVSIAANKIRGVRAALGHDFFTARQSREDDDANVLCLGARVVDLEAAIALAREFAAARFSHAPRHERRLAKVLELEAAELAGRPPATEAEAAGPARAALARLEEIDAGQRIARRDAGLWSEDERVRASIANRLGWVEAPATMRWRLGEICAFAAEVRSAGMTEAVLLGMGGSSLAAEVLAAALEPGEGALRLTVLDTTDPRTVRATRERLKLRQTLFLVSSKSGTTAETLALYRYFRAAMEGEVEAPGAHFVAITDAGTPLEYLAGDGGFRRTFLNPADIGGRFSALSYFGLVPGALAGVDVAGLLERAAAMAARSRASVPARENPGLALAAVLGGFALAGRDKLTLVLSPRIERLGAWVEQLVTESTGKQGRGIVVVNGEPPATPAGYGTDRLFVGIGLAGEPGVEERLAVLHAAGHPVLRLTLADPLDLGAEFFRWEVATAAAGVLLALNPFDEPNVAQAKEATQTALATFRERGRLPEWPAETVDDAVRVLGQARAGDYVALLPYLTASPGTTAALERLRALIGARTRLATTLGWGPRYLHSTGQLHKGGAPTPILLLLTPAAPEDLPIPGERHGFGTLMMAQALGDLATLRAAGRRALLLPLEGEPAAAIGRLADALGRRLV